MVHGVFALMNICLIVFSHVRLQRQSCQQMVHGVFALMNI
jgi:bacteriorhodopsin